MKETEDSKDPRIETIKACEERTEAENVVTELVIKPKIEELAKYLADVTDDVR